MYRIAKILNHNSFIGVEEKENRECLVLGKGIVFGKKVGQRIEAAPEHTVYSLQELTERGKPKQS